MNTLISIILHPLISLNVSDNDNDHEGIDVFYPLSIFFAFGIWLVVQRYHKARNSAIPFHINIPEVCYQTSLVYRL